MFWGSFTLFSGISGLIPLPASPSRLKWLSYPGKGHSSFFYYWVKAGGMEGRPHLWLLGPRKLHLDWISASGCESLLCPLESRTENWDMMTKGNYSPGHEKFHSESTILELLAYSLSFRVTGRQFEIRTILESLWLSGRQSLAPTEEVSEGRALQGSRSWVVILRWLWTIQGVLGIWVIQPSATRRLLNGVACSLFS